MTKRISERQRWVQVAWFPTPGDTANPVQTRQKVQEMVAVIEAFAKVGRVVRAEPANYSNGIILKARKS